MLENIKQLTIGRKNYPIEFEIAGNFAMFSRPDAGSEEDSYPAPTFSALKGMNRKPIIGDIIHYKISFDSESKNRAIN